MSESYTIRIRTDVVEDEPIEFSGIQDDARESFEGEFAEDCGILRLAGNGITLVIPHERVVWYTVAVDELPSRDE